MSVDLLISGRIGTTVRLPSGCFRNTWLPLWRTGSNPILESALTTSLPERTGNLGVDCQLYQFTVSLSDGLSVFAQDELDRFPDVLQSLSFGPPLTYRLRKFYTAGGEPLGVGVSCQADAEFASL